MRTMLNAICYALRTELLKVCIHAMKFRFPRTLLMLRINDLVIRKVLYSRPWEKSDKLIDKLFLIQYNDNCKR